MGVCKMTVKLTRLCYWIAQPAKSVVHSSNTSRVLFPVILHTPMRSRFYHTPIMYKWNWDDSCLVNLIYSAVHIFQNCNFLHWVGESWWNMPFEGTWLRDSVADHAVAILLSLWLHAAALWLKKKRLSLMTHICVTRPQWVKQCLDACLL